MGLLTTMPSATASRLPSAATCGGASARPRAAARLAGALLGGLLVGAAAACGGSGGSPAATGTPSATPTASVTAESSQPTAVSPSTNPPNVHVVEIRITGGKVSPPPGRVDIARGETVRLVVHSDAADEVHVHGYDRETQVGPGSDAVIEFVADKTGLFEVETHERGLVLTQLAVR